MYFDLIHPIILSYVLIPQTKPLPASPPTFLSFYSVLTALNLGSLPEHECSVTHLSKSNFPVTIPLRNMIPESALYSSH